MPGRGSAEFDGVIHSGSALQQSSRRIDGSSEFELVRQKEGLSREPGRARKTERLSVAHTTHFDATLVRSRGAFNLRNWRIHAMSHVQFVSHFAVPTLSAGVLAAFVGVVISPARATEAALLE